MKEAVKEGIAIVMAGKQPISDASLALPADGVSDTAVEAFGHAVGLRSVGPGQPMLDAGFSAKPVERVPAGGLALGFAFHIDGEAVGELGAVVGKDSMNGCREVVAEAFAVLPSRRGWISR